MDFVRLVLLVVLVSVQRLGFCGWDPYGGRWGVFARGSVQLEMRGVPGILRNVRVKLVLGAVGRGVGDTGQPHGAGQAKGKIAKDNFAMKTARN